MILRPLLSNSPATTAAEVEPAWAIVSRTQAVEALQYLLITQPDHARLSAELAVLLRAPFMPEVKQTIAKAIAVHDDGWARRFPFERDLRGDPPRTNTGRPQHFMQVTVEESIAAWTGSIKAAGEVSRLGEYMVSAHFSRIGRTRMQTEVDTPEDLRHLEGFVQEEEEWQTKHEPEIGLGHEKLSAYVDLLQFCDLLSLYLCCGTTQPAEFPQEFNGEKVSIRYEDGVYYTSLSIFGDTPQRFYLPVRVYPSAEAEGFTRIGFHVK
jgi:uncharacterized protein DUF3891